MFLSDISPELRRSLSRSCCCEPVKQCSGGQTVGVPHEMPSRALPLSFILAAWLVPLCRLLLSYPPVLPTKLKTGRLFLASVIMKRGMASHCGISDCVLDYCTAKAEAARFTPVHTIIVVGVSIPRAFNFCIGTRVISANQKDTLLCRTYLVGDRLAGQQIKPCPADWGGAGLAGWGGVGRCWRRAATC